MPRSHGEVPAFDLWLEFELWRRMPDAPEGSPIYDPEDDFCNISVTLGDGATYAVNVWTFGYLARVRRELTETGESLGGRYLMPPDLFVDRLDRPTIQAVIEDMIIEGGLPETWLSSSATGNVDEVSDTSRSGTFGQRDRKSVV